MRPERAPRGLADVERLQRDRANLGATLGLIERGILQNADDAIGVGAELVGGRAGPGGAGEREQDERERSEEERRAGPARQAMTLIRA